MSIRIVVPGIPPSVNTYVRHTLKGGHYKSEATEEWSQRLGYVARQLMGYMLEAQSVSIHVHLGHGQRGDLDNFFKVPIDCLVRGQIIRSDATITHLEARKSRVNKGEEAYTEIEIS